MPSLVLLTAGIVLSQFYRSTMAVLAPYLAAELGATPADLGTMSGIWFFAFALAQLPIGVAIDRWGIARSVVLCLAIGVVGALLFADAASIADVLLGRVVVVRVRAVLIEVRDVLAPAGAQVVDGRAGELLRRAGMVAGRGPVIRRRGDGPLDCGRSCHGLDLACHAPSAPGAAVCLLAAWGQPLVEIEAWRKQRDKGTAAGSSPALQPDRTYLTICSY